MTDSKTLARPAQVTMAAWVAMVGSVFVVFYAFSVVANLRTLETRERVEDTVADNPWLGLGVEGYLDFLHVAAMVAAGCAAATAILGWHVLSRSRSSRIALTVLVVPLFVAGLFTDGFMSFMVAFSAIFLWLKPSRDWFNGIAPAPSGLAERQAPTPPAVGSPGAPPPASEPPATPAPSKAAPPRPAFTTARPTEVLQACVLTWTFAGLVLIGTVFTMMGVLVAPDSFRETWEDSAQADELTFATVKRAILVGGTVVALWSVGAIVLAVFAMLGRNWARVTLLVSAAASGMIWLVASPDANFLLIPFVACVFVVVLLLRPSVVAWYTRRY